MDKTRTRIETLSTRRDARGVLFEPVDVAQIEASRNVHVVLTEPGCVRGNHSHPLGTEISVVTGPALVRLKEDGEIRDIEVPAGEVWRFTVPPGVTHAYRNPGPGPMLMIGFNTELHDPASPDAVREEIL
ncbi:MAG TPA: cupin domain-containing protein [Steroidobacteraceae bacterium]|nr:cupin domain-containing protein [Steroidobacteraceae bacterium]